MEQIEQQLFDLLKAALFTNALVELDDWESVFNEMKVQSVAALPGEWLKAHPIAPLWSKYCSLQQGHWIRIMHAQSQLIQLLEDNHVPSVIIKGSSAAMHYPHPTLRSMGDIDVLVKRGDLERAAEVMEQNGYVLTHEKRNERHHYNYTKDNISIELHKRLEVVDDKDEDLLTVFEDGIDHRERHEINGYSFPTLSPP